MSGNLFEYYRKNLQYLRMLGSEFASEYPKVAGRLDLHSQECRDPFVERLLEGAAFLAARVEKKFDDGLPELLEAILAAVSPESLEPLASFAVLKLASDPGSRGTRRGIRVPRQSLFETDPVTLYHSSTNHGTPCRFSTLWETTLTPIVCERVAYHARGVGLAEEAAALELNLTLPAGAAMGIERLDTFWNLAPGDASALARALLEDTMGVYVAEADGNYRAVSGIRATLPAVTELTPYSALTNFQQWFARPELFSFIRLEGLSNALENLTGGSFKLLFIFRRREPAFMNGLDPTSCSTGCVPVVNLFTKRTSRTLDMSGETYLLTAERSAPFDYEIHRVLKLEAFNSANELLLEIRPGQNAFFEENKESVKASFHVLRRRRAFPGEGAGGDTRILERLRRTNYLPEAVSVQISGAQWQDVCDRAVQLCAEVLCSNADLPVFIRPQSLLRPLYVKDIKSATFAVAPCLPQKSLCEAGMKSDWEHLSLLTVNFASVLASGSEALLNYLRRLVYTASLTGRDTAELLSQGIETVDVRRSLFRFTLNGVVFFENGWQVTVQVSEAAFEGRGYYVFGILLAQAFARLTSINTPLRMILKTAESSTVATWTMSEN